MSILNVDPLICRTAKKPNLPSCKDEGSVLKCEGVIAIKYGNGWIVYAEGEDKKKLAGLGCIQLPYIDITGLAFLTALGFLIGLAIDRLVESH